MSIFSSIRKSRQSAKSHNAKLAEQKKMEECATPYRHVPTHAASDAIASAPPSWREADKVRIVEENRRRSAMAANGHHMNMPGTPRIGSSLSYVAYPSDGTSSPTVPPIPRAYSHSAVPNLPSHVMYGVPQMAYSQPLSLKGKEVTRWPIYESPDQDPGYGKDAQSVADSSTESSSSRDNLEMRSAQPIGNAISVAETRWQPSPTRSRRKSDPFGDHKQGSVKSNRSSHGLASVRDPRPPPSTRGFSAIPTSAVPPPIPGTRLPGQLPLATSPTTASMVPLGATGLAATPPTASGPGELAVKPPVLKPSRASSAASLPALTPTSSRLPQSVPGTPGVSANASFEFPFPSVASPTTEGSGGMPSQMMDTGGAVQPPSMAPAVSKTRDRRSSRPPRFTELEPINSAPEGPQRSTSQARSQDAPSLLTQSQIVNKLPEPVVPEADEGKNTKGRKQRKGGNKLVKKQRVASSTSVR